MVDFKGGRLPNHGAPRLTLTGTTVGGGNYNPPPSVDWHSNVPASSWGMGGNDEIGDCTCAEVDHTIKALQVAAGNPEVHSATGEVVSAYSAITGYDPSQTDAHGNNPTDQGAVMQDVRDYWRRTGFTLGGKVDKILLFAQVDHIDLQLVRWCVAQFGAIGLGINFPDTAMEQFNSGQPWDVVKGASIEGGHAISLVGYDAAYAYVVTWGRVQKMTWTFFRAYVEEAWVQLSEDFVNRVSGKDPLSATLYALGEEFARVTGKPNPIPAPAPSPTPIPPIPVPVPTPSPAPLPPKVVEWARRTATHSHSYSKQDQAAAKELLAAFGIDL